MAAGKTTKNLDVSIHAFEELTEFNSISVEKLRQHMTNDPDLRLLIDHINNGFPDTSVKYPECIRPYFSFRDELSTCNGLVLKGNNRIVVPASVRWQAINLLHNKTHLGLSKTLECARMCMYLPGITDEIKTLFQHVNHV